jgi:mRNA interferase MazF
MKTPERGDLIHFEFDQTAGHEQARYRPALVLSPGEYNHKAGLAVVCAITSKVKGYPFEVTLPADLKISGVVLSDQVRTIDWKARKVQVLDHAPADCIAQVQEKLGKLIF